MNTTNATDPAATVQLEKMKIRPSRARITKCPAVMFANNRSVSANGLTSFPIEIIGKLVKPFALTLRLFANMTAGHFVILALLGLIFIFSSWLVAAATVAFVV